MFHLWNVGRSWVKIVHINKQICGLNLGCLEVFHALHEAGVAAIDVDFADLDVMSEDLISATGTFSGLWSKY